MLLDSVYESVFIAFYRSKAKPKRQRTIKGNTFSIDVYTNHTTGIYIEDVHKRNGKYISNYFGGGRFRTFDVALVSKTVVFKAYKKLHKLSKKK